MVYVVIVRVKALSGVGSSDSLRLTSRLREYRTERRQRDPTKLREQDYLPTTNNNMKDDRRTLLLILSLESCVNNRNMWSIIVAYYASDEVHCYATCNRSTPVSVALQPRR